MAVLGSDNISHSGNFKINVNSADRFTITSDGSILINPVGIGTTTLTIDPSERIKDQSYNSFVNTTGGVSGFYSTRFHSTDYVSGRISFYDGSWRNLINSEGGWAIRSSGAGNLDFHTQNTGSAAGTALTLPVRLRIQGDGVVNFHGTTAAIRPSGGDIVQFFQNRNGTTPFWFFNTSGNFGVFSDERLKENITEVNNQVCFDFIKSLVPIEFNWKEGCGNVETRLIGFSAQNILESSITEGQKNAITNWECYEKDNLDCPFLGLADHRLMPSLVGTIKTLIEKIETLEARVLELEAS